MKKKLHADLFGAAIAAAAVSVYMAAPGHLSKRKKKLFTGVYYAHRGLHSQDKSVPENSLEAFRLAAREGYGAELDVQLSKDGKVVVFHDDTLNRVCGVDAKVDDLTFEELEKLRLCGTEHRIPLFSEVLKTYKGVGPLIVELKTGRRNKELCKKTYKLLKRYRGVVCIESFDPRIVAWFRFHAPRMVRGQLAKKGYQYPSILPKGLSFMLSHTLFNFLARPQFIAYDLVPQRPFIVRLSERMGAMKIGWTAWRDKYEGEFDGIIFEFFKPKPRY